MNNKQAFDAGFKYCATQWADRRDLIPDMDCDLYAADKESILAEMGSGSAQGPMKVPDGWKVIRNDSGFIIKETAGVGLTNSTAIFPDEEEIIERFIFALLSDNISPQQPLAINKERNDE